MPCVRTAASVLRSCVVAALTLLLVAAINVQSQSTQKELETPDKVLVSITNRNGRVTVIASDDRKKVFVEAASAGAPLTPDDVQTSVKGGSVLIDVRARRDQDRIDLTVRVPPRSRLRISTETGAVDVVGNVEFADVQTNTGTIHADVPLDAVQYSFLWEASRPRYLSDVELAEIKEKAGGHFLLAGWLGAKIPKHKKHKKAAGAGPEKPNTEEANLEEAKLEKTNVEKRAEPESKTDGEQSGDADKVATADSTKLVRLDFRTRRGVILLNVDPSMVPSDLHERPLTEAAKAIVRSGDAPLVDAIRKVSPKMFGDYAKTLPPIERQPTLTNNSPHVQFVSVVAPQLLRVHASVTDRNGRALGNLNLSDFTVWENGVERRVTSVAPANEPFNLVLMLDVSGSVEERIDFIRKAARDFLNTASPQDRISIISFRDDIQIISDFSTDRRLLSKKLDDIDAGGATALYDSLGYVLSTTLKPLRGERTAVVILSDGDDNKSFIPVPALLEATIESGALIYPLYLPSGLIPESSVAKPEVTVDPLRSRYLTLTTRAEEDGRKLATSSGGVYYPIHRLEDLQRAYNDVVAQLRTAYTITYSSNSTPSERRVKVRANREGASVRLSPVVGVATP